jgi:hypothetical protein
VEAFPDLAAARTCAAASLTQLPPALRQLEPWTVPVAISPGLRALAAEVDQAIAARLAPNAAPDRSA